MPLSIIVPIDLDLPFHRDGRGDSGETPTFHGDTSATPSEEGESLSGWPSSHSRSNSLRKPASTASKHRQPAPSRKSSTSSLPIFNRRPPLTPPVVHWCPSPDSPSTSSSTLVSSPQEDNETAGSAVDSRQLRVHLQTCLDENRLANRGITMDTTVSHCVELKGFTDHPIFQSDAAFQQLLTLATMLDFALEDTNHEGLNHIVQGLVRGVDDFLERLERLPFDLRNMPSFISGISDILQTKSALLGVAGKLSAQADAMALYNVVKHCQHERDKLLRAIRVFFDIADFESRLQAKLSVKPASDPEPSPKRKFRFRLSRRQSTHASTQRTKLPEASPDGDANQFESEDNAANEDEDEYNFHVAMVSDILSPQESDQYWGVRMPEPVHDAADIVLSEEDESLKGASLAALVYMLTDPQPRLQSINDADLQHTFLLCFRSFCDPVNLAKALIARLEEKPVGLNDSQREAWPLYQSLVYVLVANLIETWIDHYWVPDKDRIAGLHIKDFISQEHGQFDLNVRDKIVQKLNEKREVAISLAPSGDTADQSRPEPTVINASVRLACRRKSIRYKDRLQARVEKLVRRVHQPTPTDEDIQSARTLDDLIGSAPDGQIHILTLNSRELCQELSRQLAIFMSEGYRRVIPDDLWFRFGMGYDCDGDTARSTQQAYECALSSWVTASILEQVDANARAAAMTFFIALAMRSHEYHNYCAMRSIYDGLSHSCLDKLSDIRLPLSETARLALERLSELKENLDAIALDGRAIALFPRPAVPAMDWYFDALGAAVNAKPLLGSPNSHVPIANMDRCFSVTRILSEMEHWHVPYNYPRADNAQAWLLKCLETTIVRDAERDGDWMFRQSEAIEQTGRPESTERGLRLPRLSNPFGKKNNKAEWKEATLFGLIPELEAACTAC